MLLFRGPTLKKKQIFFKLQNLSTVERGLFSLGMCRGFLFGATAPQRARASSFPMFLDHTQRRTTVGRTPLDE